VLSSVVGKIAWERKTCGCVEKLIDSNLSENAWRRKYAPKMMIFSGARQKWFYSLARHGTRLKKNSKLTHYKINHLSTINDSTNNAIFFHIHIT
jgi:hypothetical protein